MMLEASRETLPEIVGHAQQAVPRESSADLFSTTFVVPARAHLVFRSTRSKAQLPFVVVPAESEMDEFFASVATYHSGRSPITAYVHVLGQDLAEWFDAAQPTIAPERGDIGNRSQLARLGACVGETALAALSSVDATLVPSYSACRRSLGYALARTASLYPGFDADIATDRWARLRRLTGLVVSPESLRAVRMIDAAAGERFVSSVDRAIDSQLWSALSRHFQLSDASSVIQLAILDCYSGLKDIARELEGPFDSRMGAFLKLVEEVQRSTRGAEADSVAVAYFCNKILPGSFAHGKVLARLIEFFPSALVWYGAFCSTSPGFDAHHFGSGLLSKLGRDAAMPFSFAQRPQCDLSLDELEVLMRAPLKTESIKPVQQKIAAVALLPGLDIFSRFSPDDEPHAARDAMSISIEASEATIARATRLFDEGISLLRELTDKRAPNPKPANALPSGNAKRQKRR